MTGLSDRENSEAKRPRLPEPGDLVANRYHIFHELGSGGVSIVYQARDQMLGKDVAIKLLFPRGGDPERSNLRFQQEARTIAMLDHPNIIKVQDLNVTGDGLPYIVMELLHGRSLAQVFKHENLAVSQMVQIMIQACDALSHAHARGVVHRDIKPSNFILCDLNGEVQLKLVDFGIAKLQAPDAEALSLTQTGEIFGSPLYMSPEQCGGLKNIDERCDIYALGCVMYEAFACSPPFMGDTYLSVILQQLNEEPVPLIILKPDLANIQSINSIVMRCLAKAPEDRYDTAERLRRDLDIALSGGLIRYQLMARTEEIQLATIQGSEQFKVLVLNAPLRVYGFTLSQLVVVCCAAAVCVYFAKFMVMPLHRVEFMVFTVSCVIAIMKALELRPIEWWRNRIGLPARKNIEPLPELRLLPSLHSEPKALDSNQSPICWKLAGNDLALMNPYSKRQVASLMVNLIPEYSGLQIIYSSFHQQGARRPRDFHLILPAILARGRSPKQIIQNLEDIGLPLQPVSEKETRSLLNSQINQSQPIDDTDSESNSGNNLALINSCIETFSDHIIINKRHMGGMVLTRFPPETSFGWLQMISGLPCQLTLAAHFQACDHTKTRLAVQHYAMQVALCNSTGAKMDPLTLTDRSMADVSLYLCVYAHSQEQLAKDIELVKRTVGNLGGKIEIAEFRQLDCLFSCLPIAQDRLKNAHRLLSNIVATCFPFV